MRNFIKSFKKGLSRTKDNIVGKVRQAVGMAAKVDDDLLEKIEEILIQGDVGVSATMKIIDNIKKKVAHDNIKTPDEVLTELKSEISAIVQTDRDPGDLGSADGPVIWLIMGVNGTGKTTSVGKLAKYFKTQGKKTMIAACDTFRAAAVDQLAIWAERSGVDLIRARDGSDPAAVAFDAATAAKARGIDLLIIDTAGRLHTKAHLMDELKKIKQVLTKVVPVESIRSKLVLDGTTGQNALSQVKVFTDAVSSVDGLLVTKLDGTAKGGVVIAIAEEMSVPIDFIGLGEQVDDLKPFDSETFVEALFE
ncbi:MAG: signal recognition particle-docking protein FtsY [FCB group bacterium]|nr:signal recognition particle-docking protein FtsY [FCB group bacterium]